MTPETNAFAICGANEGSEALPPTEVGRNSPAPPGTLGTTVGLAAPTENMIEIPLAGVVRDLKTELATVRAQLALEQAKNLLAAAPGGATSTGAPTGIMTPTLGAGTDLREQDMGAALTAVNEGLLNSPGFEIGNEVALVRQRGADMVAQSCIMGMKKAPGLYAFWGHDGKEQLAARGALQTLNEFQQRGGSPRVPSPVGLMSAPASDLGLRRDVVPDDFTLSGTLALQSAFGKVPEFMQGSDDRVVGKEARFGISVKNNSHCANSGVNSKETILLGVPRSAEPEPDYVD